MSSGSTPQAGGNILDQAANTVTNAVNYVSESVQGAISGSQKEANKEQAKGNVPGKDSLSDRVSGGLNAASDKLDETKHDSLASANKEANKH